MYFLFLALSLAEIIEDCNTMRPGVNLVMYYQPWCRFCKKFDPIMVSIANNAAIKGVPMTIQKVNCSVCDCNSLNLRGYPTTILRENGVEIGRIGGALDCTGVGAFLKQNLCENDGQLRSKGGSPIPVSVKPQPVVVQQQPVCVEAPVSSNSVQAPAQCVEAPATAPGSVPVTSAPITSTSAPITSAPAPAPIIVTPAPTPMPVPVVTEAPAVIEVPAPAPSVVQAPVVSQPAAECVISPPSGSYTVQAANTC